MVKGIWKYKSHTKCVSLHHLFVSLLPRQLHSTYSWANIHLKCKVPWQFMKMSNRSKECQNDGLSFWSWLTRWIIFPYSVFFNSLLNNSVKQQQATQTDLNVLSIVFCGEEIQLWMGYHYSRYLMFWPRITPGDIMMLGLFCDRMFKVSN